MVAQFDSKKSIQIYGNGVLKKSDYRISIKSYFVFSILNKFG